MQECGGVRPGWVDMYGERERERARDRERERGRERERERCDRDAKIADAGLDRNVCATYLFEGN